MYAKKKSMSMKVVVLLLAVVLLIGCVAGGTLAYLIATPKTVTNTFVAGDIGELTLNETDGKGNTVSSRSFTVTPGVDITKDPKVSFSGHNVAAYVFVEVNSTTWTSDNETHRNYSSVNGKLTFSIDSSWALVDGTTNVYCKEVAADESLNNVPIIANNTITVSCELFDGEMSADTSLVFKAYAIQQAQAANDNFTPAEAWNVVNGRNPDGTTT